MLELANQSLWAAGLYPGWSAAREAQLTVVFKAVHRFDTDGTLTPVLPTPPLIEADSHHGDPETTSLCEASEIAPFKEGAELYLYGTAYPPRADLNAMEVRVGLRLRDGTQWQKSVRVFGPRHWSRFLLHHNLKVTGPVVPTPLRYEYAFGGSNPRDEDQVCAANPAGTGFNVHGGRLISDTLPRVEIGPPFIDAPTQQVPPAGFGPLPPFWEPRVSDAGEPVEDPEAFGGCPWGEDLRPGVHNAAPADQRFPKPFTGGELLSLRGLFQGQPPRHDVLIELPAHRAQLFTVIDGRTEALEPVCDTLVINTDERWLAMIYRAAVPWRLEDTRRGWVILKDPDTGADVPVPGRKERPPQTAAGA
ncbi:hypothetical protein B1C78_02640 [Thioalkalivibrio denitrificans]|uniref:DUF2169 domain-containing protein n=1 Tax=Thioalkalivibrio denitrificans TaxID=108003 RepID=A0A1V3NRZ3_9GAMM|nr:DUF2169 domain-containing protein [Thioalkalivibrio denitrificans]OOG27885.1 hypothetical protein B1C78_02640 [Thioalkalivibrio denitrificans]